MLRLFVLLAMLAITQHPPNAVGQDPELDYVRDVRPILRKHCYSCHGETKQKSGLRLDIKSEAFRGGDGYGPSLVAGESGESPLIEVVVSDDEDTRMPPDSESLSAAEIDILTKWIDGGAVWPDGVDLAKLEDRMDHWSFKPVIATEVPAVRHDQWPRGDIDRFILSRLEQQGLAPASQASAATWLRRVTLDLTGLLPTSQQMTEFLDRAGKDEAAYAGVVDRLLRSPRYGERWAQHWLDVVRYADTHGFEVNTERPNAWPYRDYVIAAFNDDTPYDRFIREQIVGDAMGEDAATGFLVTASVLLPGQIGKDAPSIRLARQDSLDEMVNNIGQTFLGLSVGCARCHDHKFDPISAKDYYSMQAFVAGVEYGDREIHSAEAETLKRQAAPLREQIAMINQRLAQFVPIARPRSERRVTDAQENVETFAAVDAKFVRFTIHDANLHPKLGLIEPCIDEFEIYTDEAEPRNIALATLGTIASASGSRNSPSHKLEHLNDGQHGNQRSWMSTTNGRGWVMLELPQSTRISKVIWSRDRKGKYQDRLATAFTLEVGQSIDKLTTVAEVVSLRPTVGAGPLNTDRFRPVSAKRIRFTILDTNSLEPCMDEVEVFNTAGENIALASLGTQITTSGDTIVANRHDPSFVNDGQYGNERSWLGNEAGKGWVEFEFSKEQEITRVLWSRDRKGKFEDRLPIEYRIEVQSGEKVDGTWLLVADSTDRPPHVAGMSRGPKFTLAGLTAEDVEEASRLLSEMTTLQNKIKAAESGQLAFAGTFRIPDEIHLLSRGDPEQPQEEVVPAVLSAIGDVALSNETAEQDRRKVLADWIANPKNPMTARVMVNRIWQGHFGIGFVETANDFGRNGTLPSHPELLDWLALEFIRSKWSIKHLHRLIVLSSTYRQSTEHNPQAVELDADMRLLWRFPSRRMEAESIRDCMLEASGRLDLKMGGRGFSLFKQRGGLTGFTPIESFSGDGLRRMIYAHKVRRERDAVFGAFDCPDAGQSTARRIESTTPIQSLNLFNSRFTIEQSDAFAARAKAEVGDNVVQQIRRVYQIALNRDPETDEIADAEPVVRAHGLATLCRVLFNSNEFLFLP